MADGSSCADTPRLARSGNPRLMRYRLDDIQFLREDESVEASVCGFRVSLGVFG